MCFIKSKHELSRNKGSFVTCRVRPEISGVSTEGQKRVKSQYKRCVLLMQTYSLNNDALHRNDAHFYP